MRVGFPIVQRLKGFVGLYSGTASMGLVRIYWERGDFGNGQYVDM